ncbi:NusG domain II-containing protein [Shewanella corallii]|uniref:NusG domain II-containing protein n=1 Tax=Shewanella corallii TaxID=560080 RepID=A0ABT0NDH3_9GAMM|nr:NusG domain II-containing protein [Shewanella corallii]MCL2916459.1 NusG domain II-containing protein [Shewanella corallii]
MEKSLLALIVAALFTFPAFANDDDSPTVVITEDGEVVVIDENGDQDTTNPVLVGRDWDED